MRDIKFRCWNDHSKIMHEWAELVEKNKIHLLANQKPSYKIMQFTGMKDKNGVEIYEGDIVSVSDGGRWDLDNLDAEIVSFDDIGWYPWTRVSAQIDLDYIVSTNSDDIEVLGNIYQNPELSGLS